MNTPVSTISRRSFLAGTAGVFAAPIVLKPSPSAAKSDLVTLALQAYGGSYQATLEKQVLKPFAKETGINVNLVPVPDLSKVKAQLLTGNVEWDLYEGEGAQAAFGSKQGFWEKLDPSLFDVNDMSVPPRGDSVSWEMYAGGIAWDPEKYVSGKHPVNFAEFFDLKKFPGRRVFRKAPSDVMELALLADGVAPKDIYPLDLDRAFKALDRVKPSVAAWVEATAQTVTLLQTGEVDFSYTYPNRVKATNEPGGGKPLAFSFEQNLLFTADFAVLKGAPNKEGAMKLIAYCLRPEVQSRFQNEAGLIPVSKKAVPMLSAEVRKWQPDPRNPNHLVSNSSYWADHYETISRRFNEWILG